MSIEEDILADIDVVVSIAIGITVYVLHAFKWFLNDEGELNSVVTQFSTISQAELNIKFDVSAAKIPSNEKCNPLKI